MSNVGNIHRESKNCSLVAKIVMTLGVIWGIAFIVAFGQVETRNEYLEIINVWSIKMIVIGCLIILNGLGLGYLILKISCILRNQEILLNEKR
ncbi:hypothetical protein SJZ98_07665 [Acinetobacter baumannii]|uniref:hypothetical protein n=1 Tax=Acinetobacter baumannii TaxID=470 RepID=UPI0024470D02|nr:hypothetical protein [Acinetobacter baumannii]MDH2504723.1 hypothetical protein [Acinetobacter baumannii]MDV7519628.1 hypothetical protein [Acinetobacter baumannii]MDX7883798.1 hypothetical protein [Acinetobacter baumannii]WOE33982.1 hypothetical protein QSG85_11620 [Acinetobacter baumannii]HEM8710150.1 hypothetical protein [Acinetobacter baumannii]